MAIMWWTDRYINKEIDKYLEKLCSFPRFLNIIARYEVDTREITPFVNRSVVLIFNGYWSSGFTLPSFKNNDKTSFFDEVFGNVRDVLEKYRKVVEAFELNLKRI
jgi:hypothetical protein